MPDTLTPIDLSKEGQAAYATRRFSEAARAYEQAARAYQAGGDAFNAAEAFNNASVAALQANDAPNAYRLAEGTDQVFSLSSDLRRQGMALANQAAALEALQRLPKALERYQRSSDLLKQCGENDLRALVLQSMSTLQLRTGNQLQALASMDSALDNKKKLSLKERLLKRLLRVPFNMLNRK
jgi:tetratricopeptide (TPR) repeat protein